MCQEADNIRLKNVTLLSSDTKPVMEVQNSRNIALDDIRYRQRRRPAAPRDRRPQQGHRLTNTNTKEAKKDVELGEKVGKKTVTVSKR